MYEIELKAHVYERDKTIDLINSFATYLGTTVKDDKYFRFGSKKKNDSIICRIRHEEYTYPDNSKKIQDVLTYKAKERRKDLNGSTYEVNDEQETTISSPATMEKLLTDTGYKVFFSKHKDIAQWTCSTPFGDAHLELCTVPPIGDFLEIEILSKSCDNDLAIQEELKKLIVKAGIPLKHIEEKFYDELIKQAEGEQK